MSTLQDLRFYPKYLSDGFLDTLMKFLSKPRWQFGYYSSVDKPYKKYWRMSLNNEDIFSDVLFQKFAEALHPEKFSLMEVYATGHTHGLHGSLSTDNDPSIYMGIIFMNPEWDIEWGGKINIVQQDGTYETVFPQYGSMILFPSDLLVYTEDISREFYGLKISLVCKLRKIT